MLGIPKDIGTINQGDTAELYANAYDQDELPLEPADISSVTFVVQAPDDTRTVTPGSITDEGQGFLRWTDTEEVGRYVAMAQFTLVSGEKRSVKITFEVRDPFSDEPLSPLDSIVDAVWLRLEDCFDSDEGGPWLRDVTLRFFNKGKIAQLMDEALTDINVAQPVTNVTLSYFVSPVQPDGSGDPDQAVLVQALLLATIRHLMRSYVEQPQPSGANVVWYDRRDYLQRWGQIYQMEEQVFTKRLALWKRQFLNLGQGALLIHSKAGRLYGPMNLRTRNVGRGGWGYR